MNQLQRDLGRVEATVEIMSKDIEKIKEDVSDMKDILTGHKAVKDSNWKSLTLVGILASLATHAFNWIKNFYV